MLLFFACVRGRFRKLLAPAEGRADLLQTRAVSPAVGAGRLRSEPGKPPGLAVRWLGRVGRGQRVAAAREAPRQQRAHSSAVPAPGTRPPRRGVAWGARCGMGWLLPPPPGPRDAAERNHHVFCSGGKTCCGARRNGGRSAKAGGGWCWMTRRCWVLAGCERMVAEESWGTRAVSAR